LLNPHQLVPDYFVLHAISMLQYNEIVLTKEIPTDLLLSLSTIDNPTC